MVQADLTTRRTQALDEISKKATMGYLDLYKQSSMVKKRKNLASVLVSSISKGASWTELLRREEDNKLQRRKSQRVSWRERETLPEKSKESSKEEASNYWQGERFTLDGVVEEVRRSYRAELDENDFFRSGREYMMKNIQIERRNSYKNQSLLKLPETMQSKFKSNYRLPSQAILSNTNFNDFYSVARPAEKQDEPRPTSLEEIAYPETPEPTLVCLASILTVNDTVNLAAQFNRSEKAISAMMMKFSEDLNKKGPKVYKRMSINLEDQKDLQILARKAKEENLKYKVFIDWEESPSPSKSEHSSYSNLSLDNKKINKVKNTFKGNFTQAIMASKLAAKLSQPEELRGLKKRARKRVEKNNPLKRENSLTLQNFKFRPKLLTANSFRSFGTL